MGGTHLIVTLRQLCLDASLERSPLVVRHNHGVIPLIWQVKAGTKRHAATTANATALCNADEFAQDGKLKLQLQAVDDLLDRLLEDVQVLILDHQEGDVHDYDSEVDAQSSCMMRFLRWLQSGDVLRMSMVRQT